MRVKTAPAKVQTAGKTLTGTTDPEIPDGEFKALVSVFGTVDSVGDVVMPGAFAKTLARYAEKGAQLPIVWSHDWDDPFSHIGYATDAEETDAGLQVTGRLDITDNPKAAQVYKLLKGGRVRDFSFAYDIKESSPGTRDGSDVMELRELDVFEVGPTLVGAHRDTELYSIKTGADAGQHKAAPEKPPEKPPNKPADKAPAGAVKTGAVKTGRTLSAKNESRIAQIAHLAAELLDSVRSENPGTQDEAKATPTQPATDEDPAEGKSDAPARPGTASARLRTDLDLLELEIAADSAHE